MFTYAKRICYDFLNELTSYYMTMTIKNTHKYAQTVMKHKSVFLCFSGFSLLA